jgi:hypothetical protein
MKTRNINGNTLEIRTAEEVAEASNFGEYYPYLTHC